MSWEVAGHDWAVRLLQGHLQHDRVRHAYLFTGPPGVGRRTLALQFARALNCLQPPAPGEACGMCRVCRQVPVMQHSDLSIVQPEGDGGAIKVEPIRDLQRALALSPYEGRYRLALLLRFHEATHSAQNALLKTLEEAPQKVILLLTADSVESLLPTIVSRCEVLRLRPMPLLEAQAELQQHGLEAEDARLLAHLSSGRLGYALNLREHPEQLETRTLLFEEMLHLLGSNRRTRFTYAEKAANDLERGEFRALYTSWLSFWRDVMLSAAGVSLHGSAVPLVNLDLQDVIASVAGRVDLAAAQAQVVAMERALARLDANVNTRLLTEVTLLDWPVLHGIAPDDSMDGGA